MKEQSDMTLPSTPAVRRGTSRQQDSHQPLCREREGCSVCRPYFVCDCSVPAACGVCESIYVEALTSAWRTGASSPHETAARALKIARAAYSPQRGPFKSYVVAIARKIGRSELRKEWNWQKRKVSLPEVADFVDESATEANERLISQMDKQVWRDALARALRRLDWRKRQYLWLRFWKELTNQEIFIHPNCMLENLATCSGRKSRVHRALIALRSLYFAPSPRPSCGMATKHRRRTRRKTRR